MALHLARCAALFRPTPLAPAGYWSCVTRGAHAALWTVVLTLFYFWQFVYLATSPGGWDPLTAVSVVLRSTGVLWTISLCPALALGTAIYGLTALPWHAARRRFGRLSRGRTDWRLGSALLHAIVLNCVLYRMWPIVPFVGVDVEFASSHFRPMPADDYGGEVRSMSLMLQVVCWMSVAVVFLQVRGALREVPRLRRTLDGTLSLLVVIGLAILLTGPLGYQRLPLLNQRLNLDEWPEEALMLARGKGRQSEAARWWRAYFLTHDDEKRPQTYSPFHSFQDSEGPTCRTVLLPPTPLLTPQGLTVRVSEASTHSTRPRWIVEIPASADQVRIYDASGDGGYSVHGLEPFPSLPPGSDWIVLKADASIRASTVRTVLGQLREHGVATITLAARPVAWYRWRPASPLIRLVPGTDAAGYARQLVPGEGKIVVYVSRWVPPAGPREKDPPPRCNPIHPWQFRHEADFLVPEPASLPGRMSLELPRSYADLVGDLSRMIAGGVQEIDLLPES